MKDKIINIIISGVGGQGVLLASEIVATAFAKSGFDVKASAARGISQRGGSICSHIRAGMKIYSPLIPAGNADIAVIMEILEINNCLNYLNKDSLVILLHRQILSGVKIPDINKYVGSLNGKLHEICKAILNISCDEISSNLKNTKAVNMFMLGILSNHLYLKKEYWLEAIRENIPFQMRNSNLAAFELGRGKPGNNKRE